MKSVMIISIHVQGHCEMCADQIMYNEKDLSWNLDGSRIHCYRCEVDHEVPVIPVHIWESGAVLSASASTLTDTDATDAHALGKVVQR